MNYLEYCGSLEICLLRFVYSIIDDLECSVHVFKETLMITVRYRAALLYSQHLRNESKRIATSLRPAWAIQQGLVPKRNLS